jgi:hypothetical protein
MASKIRSKMESVNESLIANDGKILLNGKIVGYYDYDRGSAAFWTTDLSDKQFRGDKAFDTKEEMLAFFKKYISRAAKAIEYQRKALAKFGIKYPADESVNEGVSSTDMDKIKGAVEAAKSFMSVGAELKKLGMKYTFATEPLPIYIIQPTPNNRVAIVNKKYVSKPDFVVGDIAVGVMEGKSVNEGLWPKSKLPQSFQFALAPELKKNFKGIFYSIGDDIYHNDKKVLSVDGDRDSVNSIIAKLKKIVK